MEMFYLRDSRSNCGSSAMFWAAKGGHTTSLVDAEKFTREKAVKQHNCRETDIPLRCDLVDEHHYLAVDMQYLPEQGFCSRTHIVINGEYDGNNVLFYCAAKNTFDYSMVHGFSESQAREIIGNSQRTLSYYRLEDLELVARPVVMARDLPAKQFLRKAKIKMNPRLLKKRPTTGKDRYNCETCGRLFWAYHYMELGCKQCDVDNRCFR